MQQSVHIVCSTHQNKLAPDVQEVSKLTGLQALASAPTSKIDWLCRWLKLRWISVRSISSSSRRNQSKTSCVLTTRCWQLLLLLPSKPVAWSKAKADPPFSHCHACMCITPPCLLKLAFNQHSCYGGALSTWRECSLSLLLRYMLCLMLTHILHLIMVNTNTEQSI